MSPQLPAAPEAGAPKLEWARWAGAVGRITKAFKVFPCRVDDRSVDKDGKPNAKKPRLGCRWPREATWDDLGIQVLWSTEPGSNIGLAVQPGAVVLDADIYKPGCETLLAAFEAEYEQLPPTLEFASANGGYHLLYTTARLLGNGTGSLPKFGEIRGAGGYIVGPGSTCDGKPYTVAELQMPVALPKSVDDRLEERRSTSAATKTLPPTKMLDDPISISRFITWLISDAEVSIEHQGGNNTLAKTGAMGASYGLSEDETVSLMLEHWNKRCLPPWPEDDLERHGGSGYRSSSSVFGNMARPNEALVAAALGIVDVTKGAPGAAAATSAVFRRVSEFANVAPPPRRWVVGTDNDGWIVEDDITIEYGPGGAGKSIQSAQMCRDISRGEPVFGLLPCRRMPTLFIGCEDDTAEMHRRFHKLGVRDTDDVTFACLGGQETVLHPPFRPGVELGEDTPTYSLITHQLASMAAGPKFLVLDNLAHLYHGNYFDPGNISTFLNSYLRRWVKQFNAAILLLAHPSENQRASGDGGYGGIGWSAGVRSRLYFEPHMRKTEKKSDKPQRIGDERVFSRKKSNYTREHREGEGLILDWQDWSFVPVERKAEPLFTPVTDATPVKRVSYAESVMIPVVQAAVEATLAGNPSKRWTGRELAVATSHHMGSTGTKRLEWGTIRTHYLPKLVANAHPGYDEKNETWRHATKH